FSAKSATYCSRSIVLSQSEIAAILPGPFSAAGPSLRSGRKAPRTSTIRRLHQDAIANQPAGNGQARPQRYPGRPRERSLEGCHAGAQLSEQGRQFPTTKVGQWTIERRMTQLSL